MGRVSATDLAAARCVVSEGFRATKYVDSRGFLTIGYGFNIDAGISRPAAAALLNEQIGEAEASIDSYPWYPADEVRQSVLIELAFNMGLGKLLGFKQMLAACQAKDWVMAGAQLQASAWFTQVGSRGPPLVALLTNGA